VNPFEPGSQRDPSDEISTLIDTLLAAEQRLEALTAGQVDAISDQSGRPFLLQRAQERLRRSEAVKQAAILDVLPAHIALLDTLGVIISINEGWRSFARRNALQGPAFGLGVNYLDVCDAATGDGADLAKRASVGLREVLGGTRASFSMEYACHVPGDQRWFSMTISPLAAIPPPGAVVMHVDITQRILSERATRQSSELLHAVSAGTPDTLFVKDAQGRYLLCNDAFARFVGRNADQMIGLDNAAIFGPAGARALIDADHHVMATGLATWTEEELTGRDGPRTFLVTKAPYRDERGKVVGVIGVSRDITDRKRAEEALREGRTLLAMAGRLAQVGSWFVDLPPGRVVWSDVTAQIHGEPAGFSPTVQQALDYYVPEHRDRIGEAFGNCLSNGVSFDVEYEIVGAQGRRCWVRAIGEAVRDASGHVRRVQGALQDLTERKNAERETQLLADRLSTTLDSITDGFLTLDQDWCYTYVNDEALRMLGRTREHLIGKNMWEEFPESVGTDFERGYRAAIVGPAGSTFVAFYAPWKAWISVSCYPSTTGLSIYFHDVTQARLDQTALRELNADLEARVASRTTELTAAREDAEQANRAKSAFLAAMSHEIRTPMNGVVGMIDVLEQSNLESAQADIVKTVRESAYALLGIVDDVLDFSKIEAGHFQIDNDPMSIERVMRRVCDTLDHLASSKGVALRLTIDPAMPGRVLGDAARLRQVLLNLVGNAIKFSSSGMANGSVEVRADDVAFGGNQVSVQFAIVDNGIGMDESTLSRLFTPFTQADDSTTKRYGGTGLGLSISSRLIGFMGGKILATSRPGRGSRFAMRLTFECLESEHAELLDFDRVEEAPAIRQAEPLATAPGALGEGDVARLILVAEDNEINQKVIRKQLALLGFSTELVSDGNEALERLRHGRYAMLLTDLHMPHLDGYELSIAIRNGEAVGFHMPIVALTANALKGEARRCREVGMDDYMTKPLLLSDLHAMLTKWMPREARPLPLRKLPGPGADPRRTAGEPRRRPPYQAVDLSVLTALVGTDPDVVSEIIGAFRLSAQRSIDDIRAGSANGNVKAVSDAAHTLKSGAWSIGARRLGDVCGEIELSYGAGQTNDDALRLQRFEMELIDVNRYLDAL
jgi:PAS domain S-box-containing protein